jgi:hypothetical protein
MFALRFCPEDYATPREACLAFRDHLVRELRLSASTYLDQANQCGSDYAAALQYSHEASACREIAAELSDYEFDSSTQTLENQ